MRKSRLPFKEKDEICSPLTASIWVRILVPQPKLIIMIKLLLYLNIKCTELIYNIVKKRNLLDAQEVLNWQDKLNEISVRYEKREEN
jgi:hypothetical protein